MQEYDFTIRVRAKTAADALKAADELSDLMRGRLLETAVIATVAQVVPVPPEITHPKRARRPDEEHGEHAAAAAAEN